MNFYLALQELKAGTTASADVAKLVLSTIVSNDGRRVTSADDDRCAILRSLDRSVKKRF